MRRIFLIRHGTTDLAGKLCGHLDPPLNDAGRAQAASLVRSLGNLPVDHLYASDLLRSLQTAEPLAHAQGLSVIRNAGLREISFGAWEGMRWADLVRDGAARPSIESSPEACPPDGETFNHFCRRAKNCLHDIALESPGQTTVAVTHLGVIRIAFIELARIDPTSEVLNRIDYCSIHEFETARERWRFNRRL